MARPSKPGKRTFGEVSKLPSGRYRARYTGPDQLRHSAPQTFDTKLDADGWLALRRADVMREEWTPPVTPGLRFGAYSRLWLAERELKPRTRQHYADILDRHLVEFNEVPLRRITPNMVSAWFAGLDTGPTMRAHTYSLLRTVLNTALAHDLIAANPCRVRGAGMSRPAHKPRPATLPELEIMVTAMPERYRVMVLLAAWGALRYGELAALRRNDISPDGATVHVRRGVVRVGRQIQEGTPKSAAGVRDVAVPPHLTAAVRAHLDEHAAQPGPDGLLFPSPTGGFLSPETLYRYWHPARDAAGRPDLRFHDLRHTGAVLAAATGATLAELMARLGHSTPGAAMRYQHAAAGRDVIIAARLSELVVAAANCHDRRGD